MIWSLICFLRFVKFPFLDSLLRLLICEGFVCLNLMQLKLVRGHYISKTLTNQISFQFQIDHSTLAMGHRVDI